MVRLHPPAVRLLRQTDQGARLEEAGLVRRRDG